MRPPALPLLIIPAIALAGLVLVPGAERSHPDSVVLDDFQELQNSCGGYRNAFSCSPSHADAGRFSLEPGGNRCLKIEVTRGDAGFCGAWVHLFDMHQPQRRSIDVTPWQWLSFRVRGENGGEVFDVRIADERWVRKEDALTIGPVTDWLPQGVTTEWQPVHIPLSSLRTLDRTQLASLSFSFTVPGQHTVFIDDLTLTDEPEITHTHSSLTESRPVAAPRPKAMWVWSTAELVNDAAECERLFEVCRQQNITLLWVQVPYKLDVQSDVVTCRLGQTQQLRTFIADAHARGIAVHALDGSPEFSVRHRHGIPLAVVDAVVALNATGTQEQRFDGVHFDNEPYLLMGWSNARQRDEILSELMTLNVECQRRCREAGIEFGVDLPFWWTARDEESGRTVGSVLFQGERKSAALHCIDLLDNVGIMNYRDRADGADGMLAHGLPMLDYAEKLDNAAVFMGIETFIYEPQAVWFVVGLTDTEFRAALDDRGRDYYDLSRDAGLRLFRMHDGERVHVGIELPAEAARQQVACDIAARLAIRFGDFSDGLHDDARLATAQETVGQSQEWTDFQTRPITDNDSGLTFPGFIATRLMASKVTFADNPLSEIEEETSFAEETFGRYRSYRGFALHSWESYRRKLAEGAAAVAP